LPRKLFEAAVDACLHYNLGPPVVSPAGFPRLGRKRWHEPADKGRMPAAAT
jgi:hypothetical protein